DGEHRLRVLVEIALHLDDRRHRTLHVTEEFQTHRADVLRHAMQDEGRRGDEPVASFLLYSRKPAEEFVGDVLAETFLAQPPPLDLEDLLGDGGAAIVEAA